MNDVREAARREVEGLHVAGENFNRGVLSQVRSLVFQRHRIAGEDGHLRIQLQPLVGPQ